MTFFESRLHERYTREYLRGMKIHEVYKQTSEHKLAKSLRGH